MMPRGVLGGTSLAALGVLCVLRSMTTCASAYLPSQHLLSAPQLPRLRGGQEESDEDAFSSLMAMSGCSSILRLRSGERGRGLFAAGDVKEGGVLLTVPLTACLVEPREVSEETAQALLGRPLSQAVDPASFTWDVRLALQLLTHTGKLAAPTGAPIKAASSAFWERYLQLLPSPDSMCQPLCLSAKSLDEFQHSELKDGALAQQARLRALLPEMMPEEDAPDDAFPSLLQWAFACVRSRAFVVTDKGAGDGAHQEGRNYTGSAAAGPAAPGAAAAQDAQDEVGKVDDASRFTPSAAAVEAAKKAARESGGFSMLLPQNAATGMPAVAAAGGGGAWQGDSDAAYSHDKFAFVPFLDMTNHDAEPNADFSCENGTYFLRALRPLQQGEEVLISYRKEMCNRIYQALYGFVPQGGNYNDDIEIPESVLLGDAAADGGDQGRGVEFLRPLDNPRIARLTAPLLEQALGLDDAESAQGILAQDARLNSVLLSLPLNPTLPEQGCDGDVEVQTARRLLEYVASARRAMRATSQEQDQSLMHDLLAQPASPRSAQLLSAIHYRLERKRLLEKAIAILRGYLSVLGVAT